jgi:capsular exopolysaccharide synthesis family protein
MATSPEMTGDSVAGPSERFSLRTLFAIFRRRVRIFAAIALLIFLAALIVTVRTPPRYTASAEVMFNTRREQVTNTKAVLSELPAEDGVVDTEVEVIQSRDLALKVAERLELERDPEFNWRLRPEEGLRATMSKLAGRPLRQAVAPRTEAEVLAAREAAAAALRGGLRVRRKGMTYIIAISFTSPDPVKAAQVANAYAEEYVASQVAAKYEATREANRFLGQRVAQLRGELLAAEAAVERYRNANNLLSSSGATLTEQEISALNQQLATAQAEEAAELARLRTARNQLARGSTGGDVGEALQSGVVSQLRAQRASVGARVADLQSRYGARHPELLRAQQELQEIDAQIQAEIGRVISNLEARSMVARDRTASVRQSLARSRGALAGNNAAGVRLNELERTAEAVRTEYEGLLARYQETSSQAGIETADSRIVAQAKPPGAPSSPNIPLNLALGFILAVGAGMAGVILSQMLDDGLVTADDVEARLQTPALGSIPLLTSIADRRDRNMAPAAYLLARPLSGFAEAFRSLRTSILYARLGTPVKVVTITSALPGEGKTTTAVCLAISAAQAGTKVVIVDCDIRRRNVSRTLGVEAERGLLDLLNGDAVLDDVLMQGEASGAWVLPLEKREFTPREVFNTPAMKQVLKELSDRFDLVILDTAPVLAIAETRVLAEQSDAVVFLTRWRRTPAKAADSAIRALEQSGASVVGVVLTQVDVNQQARYGYGDPGYYYSDYKKYYTA